MGLNDRVVLWKPHPSHLVQDAPRERSLVSPIPFLNVLRENIGSNIGLDGLVVINLPWISEQQMISHVLANRGEVDASGDTQTR